MKLKKISSWKNFESVESKISKNEIRSWLLESGPITKRIKKNGSFKLHLIQDELSFIKQARSLSERSDGGRVPVKANVDRGAVLQLSAEQWSGIGCSRRASTVEHSQ